MVLDAEVIRGVDDALSKGLGGFRSRDELIEEALRSYLVELVDAAGTQLRRTQAQHQTGSAVAPTPIPSRSSGSNLALIAPPSQGFVSEGEKVLIEDAPLLGLHNRDWPSLWALGRLALAASDSWVDLKSYLDGVTEEAWELAKLLKDSTGDSRSLTQMLPTNAEKKQSSDAGFQNFAVVSVSNRPSSAGLHKVSGPLAIWRAVAFTDIGTNAKIAITSTGWDLLRIAEGLSPNHPHSSMEARRFFDYLRSNSPIDWWGFDAVLREVQHEPTRDVLVAKIESMRDWSNSVAASTTQGYIARSREWGLIEPKLNRGTYRLTEFGREIISND